jgi:5-methylcytosine-specific restriction endonuclease McrA
MLSYAMTPNDSQTEIGLPARQDALLPMLTSEAARSLIEQIFVVEEAMWRQNGGSDKFIFELLRRLYGQVMEWDRCTIQGEQVLRVFRRINEKVHTRQRTEGGGKWFSQVEHAQGGQFCVACGKRDQLEVDHIVPVSRGGDREKISNLQLLCRQCNSAKKDLAGELLPTAFLTSTTGRVTPRLRFKRLQLSSIQQGTRRLGVCECGSTAKDEVLDVQPVRHMAANLLNLRITCSRCKGDKT